MFSHGLFSRGGSRLFSCPYLPILLFKSMATISQRQVQLLKSQFLQSIGQAREIVDLPVVEGILKEAAKVFLETAINNANKSNSIDTGAIVDDLTFTVEKGNGYILSIGYPPDSPAAKYFDFINKGVAGVGKITDSPYQYKTRYPSKMHVKAIEDWLKRGKMKTSASDVWEDFFLIRLTSVLM